MTDQLAALLAELGAAPIDIESHLVARFIRALPNAGEYKYRIKEATAAGKSFARQRKYSDTRLESTVALRQELELERILDDIKHQQELLKAHNLYKLIPDSVKNPTLKTLREVLL